jgi:hypothetical protein
VVKFCHHQLGRFGNDCLHEYFIFEGNLLNDSTWGLRYL